MTTVGWTFHTENASGVRRQVHPTMTGDISQDLGRDIRRTMNGLTFLPSEYAKIQDIARDPLHVTLILDEVEFPFGIWYAINSNFQPDVVLDDEGTVSDLYHIDWGCGFVKLRRSDELSRVAPQGSDPAQLMDDLVDEAGLEASITGALSNMGQDTGWGGGTLYERMVTQLAEVAGHRPPWCDFNGVFRSVAAQVVESAIIDLEDLLPTRGSILIGESFLAAPNRIVVQDNQSAAPILGVWEAPSSSPHSVARRGYPVTVVVEQQGLANAVHATQIAETIGEAQTARQLSAQVWPTALLDGPAVLRYRGSLWLCQSWNLNTAPGSTMNLEATELIL